MSALADKVFVLKARHCLALLFLVAAWVFPFAEGGSRDALRQIFALGALSAAALFFGLCATSPLVVSILVAFLSLMIVMPAPYSGGQVAGMAGALLASVGCHAGARLQRNPIGLLWLLVALTAAALINAAEGLLQWLGLAGDLWPWVADTERRGLAFGAFRQRNLFATFLCIGSVCVIWLVQLRRLTEAMAWFLVLILNFSVAASASRTGALELVALAVVGWAWRKQQPMAVTRLLLGQLLIFGLATLILPTVAHWHGFEFSSATARIASTAQDTRLILWSNTLDLIWERPWFGWGWLGMGYGHYVTLFEHRFNGLLDHAHNLPLQIAVEFGLPALAVFLLALIVCICWSWRSRSFNCIEPKNCASDRRFAWMILLVILGLHSMLEYPLWSAGFLFLTGLAIGYLLPATSPVNSFAIRVICSKYAGMLSAIALLSLSFVAWQQYAKILEIYKVPFNMREAQRAAISDASDAWLFRGYLDFAELGLTNVTPQNASAVRSRAEKLLHFSAEPRIIQPLLLSLWYLNETSALRFHAERFCRAFPDVFRRWSQDYENQPILAAAGELNAQCSPGSQKIFDKSNSLVDSNLKTSNAQRCSAHTSSTEKCMNVVGLNQWVSELGEITQSRALSFGLPAKNH